MWIAAESGRGAAELNFARSRHHMLSIIGRLWRMTTGAVGLLVTSVIAVQC